MLTAQYSWNDVEQLSKKSLEYLLKGLALFDEIGDPVNAAMLYSNCGKVHRLCAQAFVDLQNPSNKKREFSSSERHYLDQVYSVNFCHSSMKVIHELVN
jgi:hypothetical protein